MGPMHDSDNMIPPKSTAPASIVPFAKAPSSMTYSSGSSVAAKSSGTSSKLPSSYSSQVRNAVSDQAVQQEELCSSKSSLCILTCRLPVRHGDNGTQHTYYALAQGALPAILYKAGAGHPTSGTARCAPLMRLANRVPALHEVSTILLTLLAK